VSLLRTAVVKALPVATLLWLAQGLNDLARAKWERAVRRDPEDMSRLVLTTDERTLRDEFYFTREGAAELIEWRNAYIRDQRDKADEAQAALELRLDPPTK
jgi:hypothetical protein